MKKIILLSTLFGFFAFHTLAQTKKEKITEFFTLMNTDDLINSMVENITSQTFKNLPGAKNLQRDSLFATYVKEETIALKKMYDKDMVEIYDKYFTISEIQKYIDFYKSPEGKKMLEVMPALMKEMMSNMMSKDMPEIREKFKKKLEELQNQ